MSSRTGIASILDLFDEPSPAPRKMETPVALPPQIGTDLTAFAERAAILAFEAGLTRQEAATVAAVDMGHDDDASFYASQIASWRREIEALPKANAREGVALVEASREFLCSEWAMKALAAGWGETELFGLFDGPWPAPRSRHDAQGLLPAIALSSFKLTIAEITERDAILTSRTGSRLRHPRNLPGAQYCASVSAAVRTSPKISGLNLSLQM